MTMRAFHSWARRDQVIWVCGFLLAIVGHAASESVVATFAGHGRPGPTAWSSLFLLLTVMFYWAYQNPLAARPRGVPGIRAFLKGLRPWVIGAVLTVPLIGVAVEIRALTSGEASDGWPLVLYSALTFGLGFLLFELREEILAIHTRSLRQDDLTNGDGTATRPVVWLLGP